MDAHTNGMCFHGANPYTTNLNLAHNGGLFIGTSGQHGGYRWDSLIAERILSNTYINIDNLTLIPPA